MREGFDFYRRCWRQQPVLSTIQAAFALAIAVVSLVRLTAHEPPNGLTPAVVLLFLASFVCFVLLVRRDQPDLDA